MPKATTIALAKNMAETIGLIYSFRKISEIQYAVTTANNTNTNTLNALFRFIETGIINAIQQMKAIRILS